MSNVTGLGCAILFCMVTMSSIYLLLLFLATFYLFNGEYEMSGILFLISVAVGVSYALLVHISGEE